MSKSRIADIALFLAVIAAADIGPVTEADGVIAAAAIGLLRPRLLPYLVLLVAAFQDARGLSGQWWYGGTVGLGICAMLQSRSALAAVLCQSTRSFRVLLALAAVTIMYAVVSSYVQDSLGIHPQAASREPYMVGALAMAMMLIGVTCFVGTRNDRDAPFRLLTIVFLVLANGLAISAARVAYGYDQFLSPAGVTQLDAAQLVQDTPLGFPRLTGSYLTPIGFAMYIAYMLVIWEARSGGKRVAVRHMAMYAAIALVLSIMSLSKGVALYFALTLIALLATRPRLLLIAAGSVIALSIWVVNLIGVDAISTAFRIEQGISSSSYRAIAWTATVRQFGWLDWLFGTGIAYWPIFLEKHVGFALSDPHNYVLSVPGTYGFIGVAFYVVLAGCLIAAWRRYRTYPRLSALSLLVMFFIANAVSIPYVIGNTPVTACIWMAISALCAVDSSATTSTE